MDKDIKLIIPESWDEVTLSVYAKLAGFENGDSDIENLLGIMAILTDVTIEELKTIPADYFNELSESVTWIGESPILKEIVEVNIKGDKYLINHNYNKLTLGQMVSIETLIEGIKDDPHNSVSIVLGVLLSKVLSDGTLEPFDGDIAIEQIEFFKENLSIVDGLSLMVGFGNGENNFMKTILASSVVGK